jgi:hypothetical protein
MVGEKSSEVGILFRAVAPNDKFGGFPSRNAGRRQRGVTTYRAMPVLTSVALVQDSFRA